MNQVNRVNNERTPDRQAKRATGTSGMPYRPLIGALKDLKEHHHG
jgi:hypothetical protein